MEGVNQRLTFNNCRSNDDKDSITINTNLNVNNIESIYHEKQHHCSNAHFSQWKRVNT